MRIGARWIFDAGARALSNRIVLAALATGAALYMYGQAHAHGLVVDGVNGFGSDFQGTIWAPDRAILHGVSPYPSGPGPFAIEPAVYLPPIFLVTLPLGWLSLHAAIWVWFGCLLASAIGVLIVLGVRDPWCYALMLMSMPVVEALVLGNASILVALGAALAWRFRHRPIAGPVAVAATVAVKLWIWPLILWLTFLHPRSGVRAAVILVVVTLGAWAAIGFDGLLGYPALLRTDARLYLRGGVLFVAALAQANIAVTLAEAAGVLAGAVLLWAAWIRRSNDIESLSLALLAALVATPVAWPHYLVIMALPIVILWRRLSLAWAWFPALWVATHVGRYHSQSAAHSLALTLFAALPVVMIAAFGRGRLTLGQALTRRSPESAEVR